MIKERYINISISSKNLNHFISLGYNCKVKDTINVNVNELFINSHIKITAVCDICGKQNIISYQKYNKNLSKYNLYTCSKCSFNKNKITNLKKYGVDHPLKSDYIKNKLKNTNIEKYGVENVFQLNETKEKIKSTNNKKYGVDYPQQNKEILEKSNNTNIKKYGHKRASENKIVSEKSKITKKEKYNDENYNNISKIKETNLLKYGVDNVSKIDDHKHHVRSYYKDKILLKYPFVKKIDYENSIYECLCENNHVYKIGIELFHNRLSHDINTCTTCYPEHSLSSDKEKKLLKFIKDNYSGDIIENDRKILCGKELDIYLPELNLAFEFNGDYWHSNLFKEENYHDEKTIKCKNKNIKLIHIWEKDWKNKREQIESEILSVLKNNTSNIDQKTH